MISFSDSRDPRTAALEQSLRLFIRVYECKSTASISSNGVTLHPGSVLSSTARLGLIGLFYSARGKKDAKNSAYEKLSVSEKENWDESGTDLLRFRGSTPVFYSGQHF